MSKKDKKMIICFFTIWTILMIIFGIVIILYLQSEYNNRLYNTTARIISKIHNEVPEKEAEIINKIYSNEDSKKEINSGKEILNKYGITKSTSTWGDTGMDFSYKVIIGISILFLLSVVSIYFAFLIYYRKQKTKWENLNTYCQNILNGIETINLTDEEEGIESIVKNDIYDVTMLLKQANKELTVTDKKTEKLIADISHQLKTPLTSLNMINDLLYEDMPEEKRKEFLDNMHFELEKIYWLINTLLNMAKLDSKTIILKKTPENLYTLLNEVRKEFCIMCETEEVEIEIAVDKNIEINCDKKWTKEAIANLIKNAIEHNSKKIKISATKNAVYTRIYIEDNGEGIDSRDIRHIFERFYKTRNSKDNSLGLGLAFTKSIILNQGGDIKVTSKKGYGTKFMIEL